jgi:hypothetical protein
MSFSRAAEKLFAAFLRLYPAGFRGEFEREMLEVFSESIRRAERGGFPAALAVCLREIVDLPINLISEYWEEYPMRNLQLSQPILRPVWWGALGFGLSAALINAVNSAVYMLEPDSAGALAGYWNFWGELIGHLAAGGLGGVLFALICRQPAKARFYFIGASLGFLIGHLLWYPIMVGSAVLLFRTGTEDAAFLAVNIIVRWIDLALMIGLTGLFIGWMNKSLPLALRLAGNALLGAAVGGLAGLAVCGLLFLIGSPFLGRAGMITGLMFLANALAGIFGGAWLGRAIARGDGLHDIPAAA